MKKKLLQLITLGCSITLVVLFIRFKAQYYSTPLLNPNPNGGVLTNTRDSIKKDTIKKLTVLPSSKVMLVLDDMPKLKPKDTLVQIFDSVTYKLIMSGSKSATVFDRTDLFIKKKDTLPKDTLNNGKK